MSNEPGKDKQQAHQLIDQLDPAQVSAVVPLLQFMLMDAVSRSLASAPVKQEPVSAEETAALDQGRASLDRGQGISHEEILREFGLSRR
jgi:hypothetical protein